ncbi:MAG: Rieske 2Fe-2S domain-containing protein [Flavobacteriales bacterium]|nr:Rieske 2Fe-2S domain-containing protein [Flavobacteriales bacterium]MBK6754482.1 Rieske 2Fe-2S domain-containing protein [Flavobacteriales bacterium]MBK7083231.1 Rieske 2Fe-2S domain-containing protein [Flavobacteriales bacterium]MBK7270994.1 Rieske 2Fe-2S domain-containing protein [Flavobacteriales bacterium]MBK7752981.1 Rieske 2Fe-2S domain-containing protein [Flavobacteriales bacterium]
MDRRNFLLAGCKACAAMAALPTIASLESCSSTKAAAMAVENGVVTVPMSMLVNGSAVVNANGVADKILVTKNASGEYKALVLNCTHKGGPVKQKGTELSCSWHGSKFDLNGAVVNGPAKDPLKSYPVEVAGENLKVKVA